MPERTKQNPFDIRLFVRADRMHVINNWDEKAPRPLPYTQLWEVEDGPVVIDNPVGDARIFYDGEWHAMDPWETIFNGRPLSFYTFDEKWPGLVPVEEYLGSFVRKQEG